MNRLKHTWIGILLLLSLACEKEDVSKWDSINFQFSYAVEERPFSIAYMESNHTLYVATLNPSKNDYSAKIQVFGEEGALVKTLVDFASFDEGLYDRYIPVDLTLDNKQNLYVLVRPLLKQADNSWTRPSGFSILLFDAHDDFIKELDFSDIDGEGHPSSLSYYDGQLYVTNGRVLKQIDIETQQIVNIFLPIEEEDPDTWPYLHTTDMEIDDNGMIYFTGQAALNSDSVGCHLSNYNPETNDLTKKYAKGWTWMCCAMLNNPGIYLSKEGYLFLASFYQMSIEVYDENGDFILDCDTRGSGFQETRPIDILTFNKKIYVADHFNSQIHVYNLN